MAEGDPIWVCASCQSVNKIRAKQCYKCRTPKERAAYDPAVEHIGSRTVSLPDFEPSRPYAIAASILILLIGAAQALNSLYSATLTFRVVEGEELADAEFVNVGLVGLATIGIGLIALTAWAFWLSKAVRVMPALGLGYPPTNGLMAFIENFIPVLNLWRVPAIVRDMLRRLEPNETRGDVLISAAWIGLITGYLLPRFGRIVNNLGAETFEDYVRNQVLVQLISAGLIVTGSVFLVVVIWWIEERIKRRHEAGRDAAGVVAGAGVAPSPGPSQPSAGSVAATAAGATVTSEPGPLGSADVSSRLSPVLNRPITALTGGSAVVGATAGTAAVHSDAETLAADVAGDAAPAGDAEVLEAAEALEGGDAPVTAAAFLPEPEPALEPEPSLIPEPTLVPEPAVTPAPVLASAPTPTAPAAGPVLELTIDADGKMVATLDGESEPIKVDKLREAAKVLRRVNGSAVVGVREGTPKASAAAGQALLIFSDAGVSASIGQPKG